MTLEPSVSDAPNCGITYDRHSDNSRGVIYAPRVFNYAPRDTFIVQASLMMIVIYDHHIFIIQALAVNMGQILVDGFADSI
jgi:hypothetical protein